MLTGIQAHWRRRLWSPGAVARSPLSPTPCAFCRARRLGSRWQSDLADGAPDAPPADAPPADAPPAETNTVPTPNTLEWLKALRHDPIPDGSPRPPHDSHVPNDRPKRGKSRRSLRMPKNRPLLRPIMQYPTHQGHEQNLRSLHRSVTAQLIQEDYSGTTPTWAETLSKLRTRTPERSTTWERHALKIVVPDTYLDLLTNHVDNNIWDITERTTCGIELREGIMEDRRIALLLSGDNVAVQEATDIIRGLCEDAWITRPEAPLWSAEPNLALKGITESSWSSCPYKLIPTRGRQQIVDRRFEDIPHPATWNKRSFLEYIRRLSKSKLRGHRATELYGSMGAADKALMEVILDAFERPADPSVLSVCALRIALECIEDRGYSFLPQARRLFTLAQSHYLQIDTSVFNKLLLGCVRTRDLTNFNQILDFMHSHECAPNYKTWVLFFKMMHDEEAKRRVVLAMDEIGLLHNPHATRDIVLEFAELDTRRALDSSKNAPALCREMDRTYGTTWASRGALNKMLLVCGRLERYDLALELIEHFNRVYKVVPNTTTFATLLVEVGRMRDFPTALTVLRRMESRYDLVKTEQIYGIIHAIAMRRKLPNVMAVVYAYACLEDATSFPMRYRVSRQLAQPGFQMKPKFHKGVNLEPSRFAALPGYVPAELWADVNEKLRYPAQKDCQGPMLAGMYRSKLGGFVPSVPLADTIDKALAIDQRLRALEKDLAGKEGSHIVSVQGELGEQEFFDIPVDHQWGLEASVVNVPITSHAVVHNHDEEWFKDASRRPQIDILPWEITIHREEDQIKTWSESDEWKEFEKEGREELRKHERKAERRKGAPFKREFAARGRR